MITTNRIFAWVALVLSVATITNTTFAQETETPRDGIYDRTLHLERQTLAYDYVHEKDVFWEKRIWRVIDIREKRNQVFGYEKAPFINILLDAAKKGDIVVYNTFDDEFKSPMTKEEACQLGSSVDTVEVFNPDDFSTETQIVVNDLNPDDIKKYRLKEVWFFDEETSSMNVRILGIAPIITRFDDNGNFLNEGPMFWAYYPNLRDMLAKKEAFNTENDAMRMSWEDVFEARLFASVITKESNVHDRRIQDYKAGVDGLLEAEKIEQGMFNFEQGLYEY